MVIQSHLPPQLPPRRAAANPAPAPDAVTLSGETPWTDPRPWDRTQQPAVLQRRNDDGSVVLGGVRWGFVEQGSDPKTDWEPRFSPTTVDPSSIKDVYFGLEPFPGAGHALMVFELDRPITNAQGESDNRLVLSVEARKKEGEEWGALRGLGKNFGLVYQLGSFSDLVHKTCRRQGHRLELRKLNLSQQQKQELVNNALEEALADRTGEYYHTTRNSCYSGQLRLLNTVLEPEQQIPMRWNWAANLLYKPTAVTPVLSGAALKDKGLLVEGPGLLIQPDPGLHPDKQIDAGGLRGTLKSLSSQSWWTPTLRIAGGLAGALAGHQFGGVLPTLIGGYLGQHVANVAAQEISVSTNVEMTEPTQFYPAHVHGSLSG